MNREVDSVGNLRLTLNNAVKFMFLFYLYCVLFYRMTRKQKTIPLTRDVERATTTSQRYQTQERSNIIRNILSVGGLGDNGPLSTGTH